MPSSPEGHLLKRCELRRAVARAPAYHSRSNLALLLALLALAAPHGSDAQSVASLLIAWGAALTGSGTQLATWTGASVCSGATTSSWLGVTCVASLPTIVALPNKALSGTISCDISSITGLKKIDLVRTGFCGRSGCVCAAGAPDGALLRARLH